MNIKNLAPDFYDKISIDLEKLKREVPDFNIQEIDHDSLFEQYESRFIKEEPWVQVLDDSNKVLLEISNKQILAKILNDTPSHFEGLFSCLFDEYLGIFCNVADGQGGGFVLIHVNTGKWIYNTSDFSPAQTLWVRPLQTFLFISDIQTYTWHAIDLLILQKNETGEFSSLFLDLYSVNKEQKNSSEITILDQVSKEKAYTRHLSAKNKITYYSEDDSFYFYLNKAHWSLPNTRLRKLMQTSSGEHP